MDLDEKHLVSWVTRYLGSQERGLDPRRRVNEGSISEGIRGTNFLMNFICRLWFQLVIRLNRQRSWVLAKHVGVFLSNPSYTKIIFLEMTKRQKWTELAKTDRENVILYYFRMCGYRAFLRFSNLHISRTTHPNIVKYTIFLISFTSSVHQCHSFLSLGHL